MFVDRCIEDVPLFRASYVSNTAGDFDRLLGIEHVPCQDSEIKEHGRKSLELKEKLSAILGGRKIWDRRLAIYSDTREWKR